MFEGVINSLNKGLKNIMGGEVNKDKILKNNNKIIYYI
jgi:hypothetical protein